MIFTKEEESRIIKAIRTAEKGSSGEIRLYVERKCPREQPLERAAELFHKFEMQETTDRNAVLIYLAEESKVFAIWGDTGIHEKVGFQFWDEEKAILIDHFKRQEAALGLEKAVIQLGDRLRANFPVDDDENENELPDDIIYG